MFNNDSFGLMKNALKKHFFNQIDEEISLPIPPSDYFLLDNDGEILLDNSDAPFLVS